MKPVCPSASPSERGLALVATLLGAVAAAGIALALAAGSLQLRRDRDRGDRARARMLVVADAVQQSYGATLTLPASLGALTSAGYLDAADTLDPYAPSTALRLRRSGTRGTLTVWSAGRNRSNENAAGDDVVLQVVGNQLALGVTRARMLGIARGVRARLSFNRTRAALTGTNAAAFASVDADFAWLAANPQADDWHERVVAALARVAEVVAAAAQASGRDHAAQQAVLAALQADAAAVAGWSAQGGRPGLAPNASLLQSLTVGMRHWAIAALLTVDEVAQACATGRADDATWRATLATRLAGVLSRSLAAVLDAQDGDSGLVHPLAGARNSTVAMQRLGLPAAMARDGWNRVFRVEPAPHYGLRCAGADGRHATADDLVFATL